jgi:hypothetical protein
MCGFVRWAGNFLIRQKTTSLKKDLTPCTKLMALLKCVSFPYIASQYSDMYLIAHYFKFLCMLEEAQLHCSNLKLPFLSHDRLITL